MVDYLSMPYDPSGPSSLASGVDWAAGLLTGTVSTVVAMLAVAALGLMMLTGRLPTRRAAEVIAGCFVLFSARLIASALLGLAQPADAAPPPAAAAPAPYAPTTPKPAPYDPYAGASVPTTGQQQPLIK